MSENNLITTCRRHVFSLFFQGEARKNNFCFLELQCDSRARARARARMRGPNYSANHHKTRPN